MRPGLCSVLLLLAGWGAATADPRARSVYGVVTDRRGNTLRGAAVQIENMANLSIASFVTRKDGRYYFHELNPDIDFTLTAKYRRWWSKAKTLSKFDSKANTEIDLEIPIE